MSHLENLFLSRFMQELEDMVLFDRTSGADCYEAVRLALGVPDLDGSRAYPPFAITAAQQVAILQECLTHPSVVSQRQQGSLQVYLELIATLTFADFTAARVDFVGVDESSRAIVISEKVASGKGMQIMTLSVDDWDALDVLQQTIERGGPLHDQLLLSRLRQLKEQHRSQWQGCLRAKLSPQQIERGLTDPDDDVGASFSARLDFRPNDAQVERGLTDPFPGVRAVFANRSDFTPYDFQVERGLADAFDDVRVAFAARSDITLTAVQLERGLADVCPSVRKALATRNDYCPSSQQLERGLCYEDPAVRAIFIGRTDCTLSPEQLERARRDPSGHVSFALDKNYGRPEIKSDDVEDEIPDRTDGESLLEGCSSILAAEVRAANRRLRQYVTPRDVVFAVSRAARDRVCLLLQPGFSGYAWSNRKIPMVMVVGFPEFVRVRVVRSRSYRNDTKTPAVWPELRGFPRGQSASKLAKWCEATDGDSIAREVALKLPIGDPDCHVDEWELDGSDSS